EPEQERNSKMRKQPVAPPPNKYEFRKKNSLYTISREPTTHTQHTVKPTYVHPRSGEHTTHTTSNEHNSY
ncbi:unnamed protein product, partial [Lampetra fluviatilis]